MNVPFMDLRALHDPINNQIQDAIKDVISSCAFAGGPFVKTFERQFAEFCQCEYAAGVGSGTEALWMALLALGVGEGDEVITAPNTFIATAEAISFCGATPVFTDIDEQTYTLDPDLIEAAITPRTKAIIPVHLFGQMADMDPIMAVARKHGLRVVEDACQAHGAEYKGKPAGSIGDVGCFSFYPGKNLGAFGEAGAIVTNSEDIAEDICMLRDHGQAEKYKHKKIGWNGRMDGIQGAVLGVKLRYLSGWNEARAGHAETLSRMFMGCDEIITPVVSSNQTHVFHIYAIRVKDRDYVLSELGKKGVGCGIHYPTLIPSQVAYSEMVSTASNYPVAKACTEEFLSLPLFPGMSNEQIEYVVNETIKVVSDKEF